MSVGRRTKPATAFRVPWWAAQRKVLKNLRGHYNYSYNRIVSNVDMNFSVEVLKDSALDELWKGAGVGEDYQKAANMVEDNVPLTTVKSMKNHPIREYRHWLYRLSVIEK